MATASNDLNYRDPTRRESVSTLINYTDKRIGSIDIKTDIVRLSFQNETGSTSIPIASTTAYTNIFSQVTPTVTTFQNRGGTNWNTSIANAPLYYGDKISCLITATATLKPVSGVTTPTVISLGILKNGVLIAPYAFTVAVPDYTNQLQTSNLFITVTEPVGPGDVFTLGVKNSTANPLNYNIFQAGLSLRPIELTIPKAG